MAALPKCSPHRTTQPPGSGMGSALSHVGPYYVPPWFFEIDSMSGTKAKVIFDETELALFKSWQAEKKHNHDRIGYIFSGFELHAFMRWCDGEVVLPAPLEQPSACWNLPAPGCGHMLHPVNKGSFRCPHCEIKICLGFQELLVSAMEHAQKQATDTKYLQDVATARERYHAARSGWRHARLILIHAVLHHEKLAELEAKWLQSNEATSWPRTALKERINTSASAVEFAYANTKYQAIIMDAHNGIDVSAIKPSKDKKKKRVTFATHVEECAEPRASYMFDRNGSHYVPGKYAPKSESAYINTSGYKSDMASIQQLKMYVVKSGPCLATPIVTQEGMVGLHPLWPQIRDLMKSEEDGEMDEQTDGLVVHRNNMGVVTGYEFAPVEGSAEEGADPLLWWTMGWTSLNQL
ncbi:hypothetical protein P171DRAFT_513834 [Karstenula rhodostoma CBS 690.94]|uniref:Uncharacterized protein n=1 Tax=Karstenula rhodostoma CBS 690.94 TaxID=1392251 RepID=A0A9P4PKS7_9PLEO|nr:hypothetical protein P171DRAFT_513834 [Karstenula rhodostoma CBS 690.94]